MTVRETVKASGTRFGAKDLAQLFAGAKRVVVSRGSRATALDLTESPPGSAAFASAVLGPTGNLRAPSARLQRGVWLVGFGEAGWSEALD